MTEEAIIDMLEEILKELAALRQDVQYIRENTPVQMIPADPDSEVQ